MEEDDWKGRKEEELLCLKCPLCSCFCEVKCYLLQIKEVPGFYL